MIKALETELGRKKNESSIVALKVSAVFVFCQKDLMEVRWLGSVCDLLPYLQAFIAASLVTMHAYAYSFWCHCE